MWVLGTVLLVAVVSGELWEKDMSDEIFIETNTEDFHKVGCVDR